MQDMPSVERFDDTDFQALSRRIIESTAECAICLAALEVGEDSNESLGDLNWRIDVFGLYQNYIVCLDWLFIVYLCFILILIRYDVNM